MEGMICLQFQKIKVYISNIFELIIRHIFNRNARGTNAAIDKIFSIADVLLRANRRAIPLSSLLQCI